MNPNDVAFILITYLLFTFKVGPYIMEKRQPFQIKTFIVIYNVFKIINSVILGSRFLSYVIDNGLFPRTCKYNNNTVYTIAVLYWKYMAASILDLFDTVFLVICKKYSLVTFHQAFYNVLLLITAWSCLKYDPTDQWMCTNMMSCFIHTVIYVYNALTTMEPTYAKYLWWKKYLMIVLMIQFVLVATQVVIQASTSQCQIHAGTYWVGLLNLSLYICLLIDFHHKTYGAGEVNFTNNKYYE
ncbi:hypothetical protein O3G_MSEX002384 [Manduca sexta]|uniref:Elongation of very long chain fatty acids protein n=2 Tax=Manduca sexta TaxID=7130 RepID=A0A921YPS2_MANSE|nr:hypothetical protein O3G_MSEX002384 [Manduca sexta]